MLLKLVSRWVIACLLATLVAPTLDAQDTKSTDLAPGTYYVKAKQAFIHKTNSAKSEKIFTVILYERVRVLSTSGGMAEVKHTYDGTFTVSGWMKTSDIGAAVK